MKSFSVSLFLHGNIHPWTGTQHCLRQCEGKEGVCVNDHTGCLYNDGHNGCGHGAKLPVEGKWDSPLNKKSE